MRATRAYLASLGTTGLLVLAAFAILFTASALLAFNGWPGEQAADRAGTVLIDPGREFSPDTGPGEVAAEAAEAADDVAFAPDTTAGGGTGGGDDSDGNAPGDDGSGGPGDGDPGGDDPDGGAPDGGAPDVPTDPSPPGGGGGGTPPGNGGVQLPGGGSLLPGGDVSLTDGVADGVESLTGFLGTDVVAPVNPQLGQVLTGTGQALTDIVRALDGTP